MRFKDKRQHLKRKLTLENVKAERTQDKYDSNLSMLKLLDPDTGLFVEGQNAKCEAALAMWQAGECSRMDAIEAMPDRAWGTERAEQWSGILGDRGTGDDQIARTKFGFNLNVTGAAWTTCACEAVIGTVMLVFDSDVFLSVAQDNFDGRGDALGDVGGLLGGA